MLPDTHRYKFNENDIDENVSQSIWFNIEKKKEGHSSMRPSLISNNDNNHSFTIPMAQNLSIRF